jgi:hypothetical protein
VTPGSNDAPLGVFDCSLGGLTVVRAGDGRGGGRFLGQAVEHVQPIDL